MREKWVLFLIVLLAVLLRFYQVGQTPPGINSDEVAIGWNAYSILKTGRDEYGQFLPLVFRSYDDYKPPLYVYLTVPSIVLFGLTEFAVRFPAAVLGVGAVVAGFFLARELGGGRFGLLSALFLTVLPWHLQYTRTAFEAGAVPLFTTLGVAFFLRRRGLGAGVVLGLAMYLYQAARVFIPMLVGVLTLVGLADKGGKKVGVAIFLLAFLFVGSLSLATFFSPGGQIRFRGVSIFQDHRPHERTIDFSIDDWLRDDPWSVRLFHQEKLEFLPELVRGYLAHFRFDFWFSGTNGPRVNHAPLGELVPFWWAPLVIIGIFKVFSWRRSRAGIIFAWFLLAPIPAAVTSDVPSAVRTTTFLPLFAILAAAGALSVGDFVRKKFSHLRTISPFFLVAFLGFSLGSYLHQYFFHLSAENADHWYYGYADLVPYVRNLSDTYEKIVVSTAGLNEPMNFFQFYLPYDPGEFLKRDGGRVGGGFAEDRNHFDKYYFHPIDWEKMKRSSRVLFVGAPVDFPAEVRALKTFYYPSGKRSFLLVESEG